MALCSAEAGWVAPAVAKADKKKKKGKGEEGSQQQQQQAAADAELDPEKAAKKVWGALQGGRQVHGQSPCVVHGQQLFASAVACTGDAANAAHAQLCCCRCVLTLSPAWPLTANCCALAHTLVLELLASLLVRTTSF